MPTPFQQRILDVVCSIPRGRIAFYGDVATWAGTSRAARAVGQTLRTCVNSDDGVPWHRVINAQGRVTFKGDAARATAQRRLLEAEGVGFSDDGRVDVAAVRWDGDGAPTFYDAPLPPGAVPDDFDG